MTRTPPEFLQGTVEVLILRALAWEPMHGYAISRWIRDRSSDRLAIEGAALYQALHRLRRQRFIAAEWGVSENNRRARFYEITPAGRARLQTQAATWRDYAEAVARVLGTA